MSTQDSGGIQFSVDGEEQQQHFRLLELPPDLLNIVTSQNPPAFVWSSLDNGYWLISMQSTIEGNELGIWPRRSGVVYCGCDV